jgi:hypothetical protein
MAWSRATEYLPNQIGDPIREDHYAVLSVSQAGLRQVIWHGHDGRPLAVLDLKRQEK